MLCILRKYKAVSIAGKEQIGNGAIAFLIFFKAIPIG